MNIDYLLITLINKYNNQTFNRIKKNFKVSKYNPDEYILGIIIKNKSSNYTISQTQLINDLLQKYKITNIQKIKNSMLDSDKVK